MRTLLPPLSVTLPPPSMTILGPVSLNTFAVRLRTIVTGAGPQSKVMTPPLATAATKASPVQLAGVPEPTTVRGLEMSSARASAGTAQVPAGLPAGGPSTGIGGIPLGGVTVGALPGLSLTPQPSDMPSHAAAQIDKYPINRFIGALRRPIDPVLWPASSISRSLGRCLRGKEKLEEKRAKPTPIRGLLVLRLPRARVLW